MLMIGMRIIMLMEGDFDFDDHCMISVMLLEEAWIKMIWMRAMKMVIKEGFYGF